MLNKYLLDKSKDNNFEHHIQIGEYFFSHNYNPNQLQVHKSSSMTYLIVGDFVDCVEPLTSFAEISTNISKSKHISELIEKTKYLAGRFLIFVWNENQLKYVLSDPVVSIPINYSFRNDKVNISSHAGFIAENNGFIQSEDSKNIKKGAQQQHPLPYNITMYDEIKTLIPNHYLDVQNKKMVRFYPSSYIERVPMDFAVEKTIEACKNILKGYLNTRKLSLPLTSGIDSRTILSLMKKNINDIRVYTFYHNEFTDETADIKTPKAIADYFNLNYQTLPVLKLTPDIEKTISSELQGLENKRILRNGYTYASSDLSSYYPVPGDIINIAKSPFGKNIPEAFATSKYFLTKTHNYSEEIESHIKLWMEDTKKKSLTYNVSLYDLFNWEFRLGRWLPNNINNYDYFTNNVYIFNCRYLIELWVSISRKERTKRSLHLEIIQNEWPELLEFPINSDTKIIDSISSNSYLFYLGSFAKYYFSKYKKNTSH